MKFIKNINDFKPITLKKGKNLIIIVIDDIVD